MSKKYLVGKIIDERKLTFVNFESIFLNFGQKNCRTI